MKTTNRHSIPASAQPHKRQRGAILVVGLLLLLIMTLIGVTAIRSSGLEERMSGNLQDSNIAFQAAEAALRQGEQDIENVAWSSTPTESDGYYTANESSLRSAPGDTAWWEAAGNAQVYDGFDDAPSQLGAVTARYYIEKLTTLQQTKSFGESIVVGIIKKEAVSYYRITARGVGNTGNTVAVVESVFKRVD